jgi:hypothetical protein
MKPVAKVILDKVLQRGEFQKERRCGKQFARREEVTR